MLGTFTPRPGEYQPAAVPLPDDKGEHAVEVVDTGGTPGVVGLENDLGVALGEEAVP